MFRSKYYRKKPFFMQVSIRALIAVIAAVLLFLPFDRAEAGTLNSSVCLTGKGVSEEEISVKLYEKPYDGTVLKIKSMEIRYSDGLIRRFPGDVVEFPGGTAPTLCTGTNDIRFSINGENFHFYIDSLPATVATYAVENAQAELATALYSHVSDSIFVTIRKYQSDESEYLLTHVIIEDPSQINSALANDTYGGERECPSDASERLGWVVGVNGSNFSWETNRPVYAGVYIKDRKIMEGTAANGMEICLMEDGTLFSPDEGTSGEELLMQGVTDTWSCGDTLLIQDGEAVNVGIQSNQYRYPRTAIGMVEPGEYYLITAGSGHYKGGMTYDEVRDVLLAHGCTYGKCMDGGGSSTLVFENEVINVPAEGSGRERAVEDFLYFSERAAIR